MQLIHIYTQNKYNGGLVLINKSSFFLLSRFIFACRLVLYLYACAVENPEIPGFCTVSKSRGLRTDHKWVKKIETQCCSVTQTRDHCIVIFASFYNKNNKLYCAFSTNILKYIITNFHMLYYFELNTCIVTTVSGVSNTLTRCATLRLQLFYT